MAKIVNLTAGTLRLKNKEGLTVEIPPSGWALSCAYETCKEREVQCEGAGTIEVHYMTLDAVPRIVPSDPTITRLFDRGPVETAEAEAVAKAKATLQAMNEDIWASKDKFLFVVYFRTLRALLSSGYNHLQIGAPEPLNESVIITYHNASNEGGQ